MVCCSHSDQVPGNGAHIVLGGLNPFSWNSSQSALSRGAAVWQAPQARLKRRAKAGSACAHGGASSGSIRAARGATEHSCPLDAGLLKDSSTRQRFCDRAPHRSLRGVRTFPLTLKPDGSWIMRFTVVGVDLSCLEREDPVCASMAVIIGDDDGF